MLNDYSEGIYIKLCKTHIESDKTCLKWYENLNYDMKRELK